ncbi:hypothetical protein [Undibacterium sp. Xuan67W]|uniref:hypothetical protein n=1 Tax=Undibacterium sp. Xuan67W TaxID=3413057 RepID=UPI003BF37EDD
MRIDHIGNQKLKAFICGIQHTSELRDELSAVGLSLRDASGLTQCQTLLLVLQYLGARGMNTLEGIACGFLRIATRVQELEADGHIIHSIKERAIDAGGLVHAGIARYIYKGMKPIDDRQGSLDLNEAYL